MSTNKHIPVLCIALLAFSTVACRQNKQKTQGERVVVEASTVTGSVIVDSANVQPFYNVLNTMKLPAQYSFELLTDTPNFLDVPDSLCTFFRQPHLDNFKAVKLPPKGSIKLILLSAQTESGDGIFYLYTLSSKLQIIDKLCIYSAGDVEHNGVQGSMATTFMINELYEVSLKCYFTSYKDDKEELVNEKKYVINRDGEFIDIPKHTLPSKDTILLTRNPDSL